MLGGQCNIGEAILRCWGIWTTRTLSSWWRPSWCLSLCATCLTNVVLRCSLFRHMNYWEPIHTYMFINNFLMDGMNVVNEASPQTQQLRWMLSETIDILSKFYLTVHWRISYTQSSFSFWVHPLFCIKVRGQHLYLAVTERSSSHPKTNKYRGSVWLFLALITNYNRLYSWKLVKILLTPFWSHLDIRSPGSWAPFIRPAKLHKFDHT